jgi:thiol-disulfide isomerase/thioredoxin
MSIELVYIGAAWCGTCKTIKPQLGEICKKFSVPMKELDYDKDLMDDDQEAIKKVPTIRILQDRKQVAEFIMNQVAQTEAWMTANVRLTASDDF